MELQRKVSGEYVRRAVLGFLLAALCFHRVFFYVSAADEKVVSAKTDGENIYLYVKGVFGITGETVQIGTAVCENVAVSSMDELSVPLRTVILVDNSYSIKANRRPDIQEILDGVVENRMEGEEFRIGTFSESVTWLCDYTTDYDLLRDILDGIEYLNQDTCFSDCLYEVIEDMAVASEPVYSRVIIASDGADDKVIGYTNSEVVTLLERCNIPVYTIGTLGSNSALETMFSFSRTSKADYYLLDGSVSNDDVIASLLEDHQLACILITPDAALLDGSQKNIRVILQTESGEVTLTAAVDMPFAIGNPTPEETPQIQETADPEPSDTAGDLPVLGNSTNAPLETEEEEKETLPGMLPVMIGIMVVAVATVTIGIVVLLFVLKKKKKKEQQKITEQTFENNGKQNNGTSQMREQDTVTQGAFMGGGISGSGSDETLMLNRADAYGSDSTVILWNQKQSQQEERTYLVLKDIGKANVMFKIPIQDIVRIGRKNADIIVDYDKYISAVHCEIIMRGSLLYIKDCGSSNGTFYEEGNHASKRIYDKEVPIASGTIIQIGHSKFMVTIVTE